MQKILFTYIDALAKVILSTRPDTDEDARVLEPSSRDWVLHGNRWSECHAVPHGPARTESLWQAQVHRSERLAFPGY